MLWRPFSCPHQFYMQTCGLCKVKISTRLLLSNITRISICSLVQVFWYQVSFYIVTLLDSVAWPFTVSLKFICKANASFRQKIGSLIVPFCSLLYATCLKFYAQPYLCAYNSTVSLNPIIPCFLQCFLDARLLVGQYFLAV